jgi:hypothetical protein
VVQNCWRKKAPPAVLSLERQAKNEVAVQSFKLRTNISIFAKAFQTME